jgi:hypothetical protein
MPPNVRTSPTPPAPAKAPAVPPKAPVFRAARARHATPGGPSLEDRLRRQLAGTPGQLRTLAAGMVVVSLLFGALGFSMLNRRAGALADARENVQQLVRLQTIRTRLVQADAEAANAFLVGGLEPTARRTAYVDSTSDATSTIATAAGHSPADADVLAAVNESLARYTGLVEAARANNRQGLAVGSTYLQQASALLRKEILPRLTTLVETNQERVQSRYDAAAHEGLMFGLLAVAALAALVAGQVWLARRTRRILNLGLAAATGLVLLAVFVAATAMASSQTRANRAHTHAYAATVELAQARIDAFDTKSAESLTLVARGSGQAYETEFQRVGADAREQLYAATQITEGARPALTQFNAYRQVHSEIRDADNGGDFPRAVRLATGNAANDPFALFDQASAAELRAQSALIVGDLRKARSPLRPVAALVLLGGLLAAAAASRGVAARLQEYR